MTLQSSPPKYSLLHCAGGDLTKYPPLFSIDSKWLLCISGSSIECYVLETLHKLHVLSSPQIHGHLAHQTNIVAMHLAEHDPWMVYSISLDGQLKLWDILKGSCVQSWDDYSFSLDPLVNNHVLNWWPLPKYQAFSLLLTSTPVHPPRGSHPMENVTLTQPLTTFPTKWDVTSENVTLTCQLSFWSSPLLSSTSTSMKTTSSPSFSSLLSVHPSSLISVICMSSSSKSNHSALTSEPFVHGTWKVAVTYPRVLRVYTLSFVPRTTLTTTTMETNGTTTPLSSSSSSSSPLNGWEPHLELHHVFTLDAHVSSLTLHPLGHFVVTGDGLGKIKVWNLPSRPTPTSSFSGMGIQKTMPPRVLHWHAYKVTSLCAAHQGQYLLSGGEEGVLVAWHLGSRTKQFLPRLGADILSIVMSPNEKIYALTHSTNSIQLIHSETWAPWKSIRGLHSAYIDHQPTTLLKKTLSLNNNTPSPQDFLNPLNLDASATTALSNHIFELHPHQPWVLVEPVPGTLQFYHLYQDTQVTFFPILPYRHLPHDQWTVPKLVLAKFDPTGHWLVTLDHHSYADAHNYCLKFWLFHSATHSFTFITKVSGLPRLTSLTFQSIPHATSLSTQGLPPATLVTTRVDGEINVWDVLITSPSTSSTLDSLDPETVQRDTSTPTPTSTLSNVSSMGLDHVQGIRWHCRGSMVYRGWSTAPLLSAWSPDTSLLCVVYPHAITLWNSTTLTYVTSFPVSTSSSRSSTPLHVYFGTHPVPSLVVVSKHHLAVWNLLTFQMVWEVYDVDVVCSAYHPTFHELAVVVMGVVGVEGTKGMEEPKTKPPSTTPQSCEFVVFQTSSCVPIHSTPLQEKVVSLVSIPWHSTASSFTPSGPCWACFTVSQRVLVIGHENDRVGLTQMITPSFKTSSSPSSSSSSTTTSSSVFLRPLPNSLSSSADNDHDHDHDDLSTRRSTEKVGPKQRTKLAQFLDAPSHALPSIRFMFDSLMTAVLEPRLEESTKMK
ncbi:WD repeat-containing protein 75 [Coelomomyces lativittatus]|nr:WD repeat-containing protein 75 [Coelomomyces lativittatus]